MLVQVALIVVYPGSVLGEGSIFFYYQAVILILELIHYNFSDGQELSRYKTYNKWRLVQVDLQFSLWDKLAGSEICHGTVIEKSAQVILKIT